MCVPIGELIENQYVDIVQPDVCHDGGILETLKIAAMAEAFGAEMAPHLYAGPVEWAANIQLAAAIPNCLMAETIETPFHDALIRGAIQVEDGFIPVPDAPGLGIERIDGLSMLPFDLAAGS